MDDDELDSLVRLITCQRPPGEDRTDGPIAPPARPNESGEVDHGSSQKEEALPPLVYEPPEENLRRPSPSFAKPPARKRKTGVVSEFSERIKKGADLSCLLKGSQRKRARKAATKTPPETTSGPEPATFPLLSQDMLKKVFVLPPPERLAVDENKNLDKPPLSPGCDYEDPDDKSAKESFKSRILRKMGSHLNPKQLEALGNSMSCFEKERQARQRRQEAELLK